jgi:hypothetical protein
MNDDLVNSLAGEPVELGGGGTFGVVHEAHLGSGGEFVASIRRHAGDVVAVHVERDLFRTLTAQVDTTDELTAVLSQVLDRKLADDESFAEAVDVVALGTPPGPGTGPDGEDIPPPRLPGTRQPGDPARSPTVRRPSAG